MAQIRHEHTQDFSALRIVFENGHLLVLDKPYDMNVHGGKDTLDALVKEYLSENSPKPKSLSFSPGPLHRLDRKTSGLIVFSKSLEGSQAFSKAVACHSMTKSYYAVLQGFLDSPEIWEDYIYAKEEPGNQFHRVKCAAMPPEPSDPEFGGWKKAVSKAEPLAAGVCRLKSKNEGNGNEIMVTLAKITIETGRKHQIRAQSSLHSHPLLGDTAYGGSAVKETLKKNGINSPRDGGRTFRI